MAETPIAVLTHKRDRLVNNNQYTFNVESGFTKAELTSLFGLNGKVIAMNSHRLPGKGRTRTRKRKGPIRGHRIHYKRMILTIQPEPGYSITPPIQKKKRT
uniref:Ribosomal protein L23 n=1 Tax=Monsonia marlothii TaxID=163685 RepID=A0A142G6I9_9ROSI|nr:ribosomal protein L23 [Monsonia marlothii]AMQ99487.1 ribosomal protein L23 [Monsonia marlothii]